MDDDGINRFKHPDIVHTRPELKHLHRYVIRHYAAEWKVLGTLLRLPNGILNAIEHDKRHSCRACCVQMLTEWLKCPTATWENLFTALESPKICSNFDESMSGHLRASSVDDGGLEQFKHPDKVNSRPLLKDLCEYITPCYAADWKVIGTLLGLPIGKLKAIEIDYSYRVKDQCNEMFERWL